MRLPLPLAVFTDTLLRPFGGRGGNNGLSLFIFFASKKCIMKHKRLHHCKWYIAIKTFTLYTGGYCN